MITGTPTNYATSDGLRIAYVESGSGEPLLFLNGVGSTKQIWQDQLHADPSLGHCLAFDYRGYGESELPPAESLADNATDSRAISRAAFARDALAVLDAAGVESAHVCGCSLGGVVALELYNSAPKRVRSLILEDAFAFYPHGLETIGERIAGLVKMGMLAFADSRCKGVLWPQALQKNIEHVRQQMRSIPLEVYKLATHATWTGDYRELLPKIEVPTMVIWGEFDTVIAPRALSEELARSIPTVKEIVTIPCAGHLPNLDNPECFNNEVRAFLASTTRNQSA